MQNKSRAMQVIIETDKQKNKLNKIRVRDGKEKYKEARSQVRNSLKCKDAQLKNGWIEKKVALFRDNFHKPHLPNQMDNWPGFFITPLMQNKIQYGKLKRDENIMQIQRELEARRVNFEASDNWTRLLTLLKENENDQKYFKPVTDYQVFITNDLQRPSVEVQRVQISRLKKDDNMEAVRGELRARNFSFNESATWTKLLTILKKDMNDTRYFTPRTSIDSFIIIEPCQRSTIRQQDP